MKKSILIAVVLLFNLGCSQIKEKHITKVSQNELENVVLVDVRTPGEFNEGHLKNALNIDWMGDTFSKQFEEISKEETIYLYCRSGKRSADATRFLDSLGYKHVVNLEGGYIAWEEREESITN